MKALIQHIHPAAATQALIDIAAERVRQARKEGFTAAHDDAQTEGQLAAAAAAYARLAAVDAGSRPLFFWRPFHFWPFGLDRWKPRNPRRDLVRAAALILAEIDRLDRIAALTEPKTEAAKLLAQIDKLDPAGREARRASADALLEELDRLDRAEQTAGDGEQRDHRIRPSL